MNKKQKKMLIRIAITAVMLIALAFLPLTGIWPVSYTHLDVYKRQGVYRSQDGSSIA